MSRTLEKHQKKQTIKSSETFRVLRLHFKIHEMSGWQDSRTLHRL